MQIYQCELLFRFTGIGIEFDILWSHFGPDIILDGFSFSTFVNFFFSKNFNLFLTFFSTLWHFVVSFWQRYRPWWILVKLNLPRPIFLNVLSSNNRLSSKLSIVNVGDDDGPNHDCSLLQAVQLLVDLLPCLLKHICRWITHCSHFRSPRFSLSLLRLFSF